MKYKLVLRNEKNTFLDLKPTTKGTFGGVWSPPGAYLFHLRPFWAIETPQQRKKLDFTNSNVTSVGATSTVSTVSSFF
jgi:hypothetical protein